MIFTKHRATQSDVQEIEEKFGRCVVIVNEAFVINNERDCVLCFIAQDRFDMGGTTNKFWKFAYRGKVYTVACKIGLDGPDYGPDDFNMIITAVEEDNTRRKVSSVDQDFIDTFAQAFYIHNKYSSIDPKIETARGNHIYHFSFQGEQG